MLRNFSEKDTIIWQKTGSIIARIIGLLNENSTPGPIQDATTQLHRRLTGTLDTVIFLCGESQTSHEDDTTTLLRSMYDTLLQALYILTKAEHRLERSKLYLDYYWVEKYRWMHLFDGNETAFAKHISASPKRATGEQDLRDNYNRVKQNFLGKNSKKPRRYWYTGSLRDIAKDVGYESEYELMQSMLSSVVHTSPFSMLSKQTMSKDRALMMAWHFSIRYIGAVAEAFGLKLTDEEQHAISLSKKNWFDRAPSITDSEDS